jgi:hypothetical protein
MRFTGKRGKELPEDRRMIGAGMALAADMIADNATESVRDGRWGDAVADLVEANRRAQFVLHEVIERALAEGETFQSLASESRLSSEYLQQAYERFDRGMSAQVGPGVNGREPWRVLG